MAAPSPSRPVILNVEDDASSRYALTHILQHNNFTVKEARNGREALDTVRSTPPDLVLLDVNLPDIDGFEVCRRLKSDAATARIPVLHITASYMGSSDMAKGLESGADSYLVKPVEPEVLIAAINSSLRARRAEETARAMAREWQATFDAIHDGVALVDACGRIQRSNESLRRLIGSGLDDPTASDWRALWEKLPPEREPFSRALSSGKREFIELEYDGRQISVSADPIFDESGLPAGAVMIVCDVTDRRRLEEQFRESQKFETIGTLAAGVAHDFNNLLTSVMGNASLVLSDLPADSLYREKLEDVLRAGERAASLTRQLLAYSGKGRRVMQKVDLPAVVRESRDLIEASIPKKVALELHLPEHLPRIEADVNQLQQVLLNLVGNAAEAIGEDTGSITIRAGQETPHTVFLEVRDSGCGMDAETRARIFDPFFTTKFTGRGLGLAAVAGIARGHKAALQVTSAPGEGSTFRISFPTVEEPVILAAEEPKASATAVAGGTILVVDDEKIVLRIAQTTLEMRGYRVVTASDGREAIEQVERHPEISLVLLDLTMPVMGGEEAIDRIVAAQPGIRVIVSTGYDHREAVARFSQKQVTAFLQKPYTSRQLAEKVQFALAPRTR
jgi:PAS domain S-box-containing protein